jgi:ADP-ribose pyrophosphatase YjhB (NUDIX family)
MVLRGLGAVYAGGFTSTLTPGNDPAKVDPCKHVPWYCYTPLNLFYSQECREADDVQKACEAGYFQPPPVPYGPMGLPTLIPGGDVALFPGETPEDAARRYVDEAIARSKAENDAHLAAFYKLQQEASTDDLKYKDNTILYVAIAAGVGLLLMGVIRR